MQVTERFNADTIRQMQEDLADALATGKQKTEILWIGRVDATGRIVEVYAAARGMPDSVPALFPHMIQGDVVIHNHPGGNLRPSAADMNVASRLGNQGIGFIIVNDDITEMNVLAAPIPKKERHELSVEKLGDILEPQGKLSKYLENYEPRLGQISMLKDVAKSFNEEHHLIVEAGTGIGKSLAYLLPALQWAGLNKERVVISTATIALQQQIITKDIPLALKVLSQDVQVALVKGRGNYLCLKRLEETGLEDDLFGAGNELTALRNWADESDTGEISDLSFQPSMGLWERVRCEADACPRAFCRYFERCFFMRSRRRAAKASILVSNHHLLFADLAARQDGVRQDESAVLPPYKSIIFDEAHHIEDAATSLFSALLSVSSLNRFFYRLYRRKGRHGSGLLQRLAERRPDLSDLFVGELPSLIDETRGKALILNSTGITLFADSSPLRLSGEQDETERNLLISPMQELHKSLAQLVGKFTESIRNLASENPEPEDQALELETVQTITGLQESLEVVDSFINRSEFTNQVFWLDKTRSSDGTEILQYHRTPLSVANTLKETVWESYNTVVGVSATLTFNKDFQHWRSRIGADFLEREVAEKIYPSPFNYASQVMLGLPNDAPPPEMRSAWENYLIETVAKTLDLIGGHALVLFTAYETLKTTVSGVRRILGDKAPLLLAQGDADRGQLLKQFKKQHSSVLFATDSFWEGIDVPGKALQLLIITRLPFKPPTDPLTEAHREAIAATGDNPFMKLTLPRALMQFRQGFGRLMRHRNDFGAVLVLDSRILYKQYGQLFIKAIPPTFKVISTREGILRKLESFMFSF